MQKIMFNNTYGLTKAVLNGKKTMTRRVIKDVSIIQHLNELEEDDKIHTQNADIEIIKVKIARYKLGEVVAVAQSYKDAGIDPYFLMFQPIKGSTYFAEMETEAMFTGGWNNKMFVRADLMPHQIQITGVRIERLQAISDDDCLKEGVRMRTEQHPRQEFEPEYTFGEGKYHAQNPIAAFAALIERPGVGRKGLWESNPWVIVYTFKLIK